MSFLNEYAFFARQLMKGAADVGALLPTSRFAARAMVSEAARRRGPRRIVEVGCGTGPITAQLVKILRPGDRLILCDINAPFMGYVQNRFATEPDFARVRDQVEFHACSVTELDEAEACDFIISALPFTRLGADLTRVILQKYQRMLAPTGVLSYIEYAYLRSIKDAVTHSDESASTVVDSVLREFEFRRDSVWRNAPPAWVHHLRFAAARAEDAANIEPLEHDTRVRIGAFAFDSDASRFMIGGLLLSWALWKTLKRGSWLIPLIGGLSAAWFLRDPQRTAACADGDERSVYSACDGKVLFIDRLRDARLGDGEWLRIATFLAITDVHLNRAPISGKVVEVLHQDGGHAIASSDGAERNAAQFTILDGANGRRVIVAQRVGAVARRIVNRVRAGSLLARGEKFGLIRFGSRTDVYLPVDAVESLVQPGDALIGGATKIARFR